MRHQRTENINSAKNENKEKKKKQSKNEKVIHVDDHDSPQLPVRNHE